VGINYPGLVNVTRCNRVNGRGFGAYPQFHTRREFGVRRYQTRDLMAYRITHGKSGDDDRLDSGGSKSSGRSRSVNAGGCGEVGANITLGWKFPVFAFGQKVYALRVSYL